MSERGPPVTTLPPSFYARETDRIARDLLGQNLVHEPPGGDRLVARIVETEAYLGPEDPASHARHGPDSQARRMWEAPGAAYVYVCYGIHQMMNVVAHREGDIGAVLVRAAEPVEGVDAMRARRGEAPVASVASGPGNLTEAMSIRRKEHDGADLTAPSGLRVEAGSRLEGSEVLVTTRIGLTKGTERRLRFVDAGSDSLSRPVPEGEPVKARRQNG